MAEEIRRRVAALRLAALLAVAVTLAGLTTRDAPSPTSAARVPADSVGTRQVIDGSLRFRDFREGAVLAPWEAADRYLKISAAADLYLSKLDAASDYLHKVEAAALYLKLEDAAATYLEVGAAADFLHKTEAAELYLKHEDADATYLKLEQAATFLDELEAAELYLKHEEAGAIFLKLEDAAATYLKLEEAAATYLKLEEAAELLSKVEAANTYLDKTSAALTYLHKDDAANLYLSKVEADADYWKIGDQVDAHKLDGLGAADFVQGSGTVLSGMAQLDAPGAEAPLLDLPGLARLTVTHGSETEGKETVWIGNLSEGPLLVSYDGQALQMGPDGLLQILIGLNQPSLLQIVDLGKGTVSTVTVGATQAGPEQELLFTGQALVGGR